MRSLLGIVILLVFLFHHFRYVLPSPSGLKSFYWKTSCSPYGSYLVCYLLLFFPLLLLIFALCVWSSLVLWTCVLGCLFVLITEEGFLISSCYSLEILHSNGCIFPLLLCLSLLFFSQLFVRPPQTTILPFCITFSWGWSWSLPPVQYHKPPSIVLQAFCLSDLSLKSICHFHCIIIRDLI